jgi:uncharacterized small protein (DUF1192 family)
MTVKTVKLQLERAQEENTQLHQLVKALEDKITILEDQIGRLKALSHIRDKYKNTSNNI